MSPLLPVISFALYLVALAGIMSDKLSRNSTAVAWAAGCVLHAWVLFDPTGAGGSFTFTFFNAMALTALLINALVLGLGRVPADLASRSDYSSLRSGCDLD